ncbi:uncharacterized protein LOC134192628 isoform X2 [Corticium candelabrum]|uniref:uncharacterized protein LOC134192628 isoform X2 n=1 Tax=Corticium candelabrum TaxID=121492 RepID=UPI002E26DE81|nr:uncharacterized protein LOC134192628 isoform X2 [Corticium candelabrum]
MKLVGLLACAFFAVQQTVASKPCSSLGFFSQVPCDETHSSKCYNICGGRQTPIQTFQLCLNKQTLVSKIGDEVRGVVSFNLDRPLNDALFYDFHLTFSSNRQAFFSGEVCNYQPELCHTTSTSLTLSQANFHRTQGLSSLKENCQARTGSSCAQMPASFF